jgi:exodeoxyribonuclease V alpha subunit
MIMLGFKQWPMLQESFEQGQLAWIDLTFADAVLKKIHSNRQEHAAFLAVLFALSRQGHLALDLSDKGMQTALQLLGIAEIETWSRLVQKGAEDFPSYGKEAWVYHLGQHYYLQKNWTYEADLVNGVTRLHSQSPKFLDGKPIFDARLNAAQKQAIEQALRYSLSFLTGGPGTGKTFTAAELVKTCLSCLSEEQRSQFRVIVTAPTGKAVAQLESNLTKACGTLPHLHSGTLHTVLGVKSYLAEEEQQLSLFADLILVDECSMIDARLFAKLLHAIPNGARLVLIGDRDQLPPIEVGSMFADLLDTGLYPVTYLKECLRSDRQEILALASEIKEGRVEEALVHLSQQGTDVQWHDLAKLGSGMQPCAYIWELSKHRFPAYHSQKPNPESVFNELNSFSVLSCVRQGPLGVDAVNRYFLQHHLQQMPEQGWAILPIMITRNDYELELYNGDIGFLVRRITPSFSLRRFQLEDEVIFKERKGGYRKVSALTLTAFEYSYCLSVHKSQGSEYDEVLILMPPTSEHFGREVLYTALTL